VHDRGEDLPRPSGSLEIVLKGGDIQATVLTTASGDAAALERTRLEKELAEAEGWLAAAQARLANDSFVGKAPQAVVDGARARERELAEQVDRLRERLAS
jgi:valyl-tRNA synthetase